MKRKVFLAVVVVVNVYLLAGLVAVSCIMFRYSHPDLRSIERARYIPDIQEDTLVRSREERTPFNTFSYHINAFHSRNQFEVSQEDFGSVVLLGDSVVFGYALNDNETISYFLGENDSGRKYINLAIDGFNVCDSVERYLAKRQQIGPPALVIVGVLLKNDIYDSRYVEYKLSEQVKRDSRFVLPLLGRFFSREGLLRFYVGSFEKKIHGQSASEERFTEYLRDPLSKLKARMDKDGTGIMVISYTCEPQVEYYQKRLKEYCLKNSIRFFELTELVGEEAYRHQRMPDGHPNAALNKMLAERLHHEIRSMLGKEN